MSKPQFYLFILLLLSSCGINCEIEPIPQPFESRTIYDSIILSEDNRTIFGQFEILFLNESVPIVRYGDDFLSLFDTLEIFRFLRGNGGWRLDLLYELQNTSIRRNVVALGDDELFYMPVISTKNGVESLQILQLNSSSNNHSRQPREAVVLLEREHANCVNIFIENENLILFESHTKHETNYNSITIFDLQTEQEETIIEKSFSMLTGSGDMVANIFVDNGNIYMHRKSIEYGETVDVAIDKFDFNGELVNSYILPHPQNEGVISEIFKFMDYLIIQTERNGVFIYKIENSCLIKIETPQNLQRFISFVPDNGGYMVFFNYSDNLLYAYSVQDGTLFIFDILIEETEWLSEYLFDWVYNVQGNEDGELIFQVRVDITVYWQYRAEHQKLMEKSGLFEPTGAARFMPDDSAFYRVNLVDLLESV